mgnify:FL=1
MLHKTSDWRKYVFPIAGAITGAALGGGVPRLFLSEENKNLGSAIGAIIGGLLGGGGGYFLSKIPTKEELEQAEIERAAQERLAHLSREREYLRVQALPIFIG